VDLYKSQSLLSLKKFNTKTEVSVHYLLDHVVCGEKIENERVRVWLLNLEDSNIVLAEVYPVWMISQRKSVDCRD